MVEIGVVGVDGAVVAPVTVSASVAVAVGALVLVGVGIVAVSASAVEALLGSRHVVVVVGGVGV